MSEGRWTKGHGRALRERRRRRGLTQEMLAETAGIAVPTIQNVEQGVRQPRPSTLQLIAKALGCRPETLQDGLQLPSIAVLPFRDLSPDADQDYFCEGLAEELINTLVHLNGMRVTARTSSFHYKDRREDLRTIGEALGVETVLEGSVRATDDRLRITAQLIRAEDGFHLWSEQYDRGRGDLLAIQEDVSRAIVDRLQVDLSGGERERLAKRHTRDAEAHSLYLKGLYSFNRRYAGGLQNAISHFAGAIDRDPNYALAQTSIAECYTLLGLYIWQPCYTVMPRARQAVTKALRIDNMMAEAYAALGQINAVYDWDWPTADGNFRRSIELNPNYALGRLHRGAFLAIMERFEDGLPELDRAQRLEPMSLIVNGWVAYGRLVAGQVNRAREELEALRATDPDFALTNLFLGHTYYRLGLYEETVATFEQLAQLTNQSCMSLAYLSIAYAAAGRQTATESILDKLNSLSRTQYVSPWAFGSVYGALGDAEQAYKHFDAACEIHEPLMCGLKGNPTHRSFAGDDWYDTILERIGIWQ